MSHDFAARPPRLDEQVKQAFAGALASIPEVQAIYLQHNRDEDDPDDDEVRLYVVMEELHLFAHGKVADVENEIIDALPEDYKYRYEFLRLFRKDGQVEAIIAREGLQRIYP
jgi:hypothetical protein